MQLSWLWDSTGKFIHIKFYNMTYRLSSITFNVLILSGDLVIGPHKPYSLTQKKHGQQEKPNYDPIQVLKAWLHWYFHSLLFFCLVQAKKKARKWQS